MTTSRNFPIDRSASQGAEGPVGSTLRQLGIGLGAAWRFLIQRTKARASADVIAHLRRQSDADLARLGFERASIARLVNERLQ